MNNIVIRSGGLGDFILTLPLLKELSEQKSSLTLITRKDYYDLICQEFDIDTFINIDSSIFSSFFTSSPKKSLYPIFENSTIYSFIGPTDSELNQTLNTLKVKRYIDLPSRPTAEPHIVEQIFTVAEIASVHRWKERSYLKSNNLKGKSLWLHPGSGHSSKNAPSAFFIEQANDWLKKSQESVIISFGEADQELETILKNTLKRDRYHFIHPQDLCELKQLLILHAGKFISNDTGPSHLSASLGIPTTVIFKETNPNIWEPLGEQVSSAAIGTKKPT